MNISLIDVEPIWISLKLAGVTVVILLLLGTPIAWWLAQTRSHYRVVIESLVALPLVLPPTVLGFYLLIILGPHGWVGGPVKALTGSTLSFSFLGLVLASTLYSLPFVVQPLHSAFESIGKVPMETAQSLGASRLDAFFFCYHPSCTSWLFNGNCIRFRPHPWRIWGSVDGGWQYSREDESNFDRDL